MRRHWRRSGSISELILSDAVWLWHECLVCLSKIICKIELTAETRTAGLPAVTITIVFSSHYSNQPFPFYEQCVQPWKCPVLSQKFECVNPAAMSTCNYIFAVSSTLQQCLIFPKLHLQSRWQYTRKTDLKYTSWKDMDWIDLAQDGDRWRALVHAVMNLRVP